ncbi:MAG: hypothetical protein ACI4S2_08345 [Lachnospiraceae bacterium]
MALALTNIPVDEEIILALINAGADVNSKADDGSTYLMGDFRGADEILLEAGIDVNAINRARQQ